MEAPLRQTPNCGEEPSVVANTVKGGDGNYGYNAATEEYGNMTIRVSPTQPKLPVLRCSTRLLWLV